jgi:hypothetical protein
MRAPVSVQGALRAIWGGGGQIWAVGDNSTAVHWDGTVWSASSNPTHSDLFAVWGSSPEDVWVVGSLGLITHWNGAAWATSPSTTTADLRAMGGVAATDAWAVGSAGTILHWDGTAWTPSASGATVDLKAIWPRATNDVWVSGTAGTILRWNGSKWSSFPSPTSLDVVSLWGTGADNVWGVTAQDTVIHWDGRAWSASSVPADSSGTGHTAWLAVFGTGSDEMWVAGVLCTDVLESLPPNLLMRESCAPASARWNGADWTRESPQDLRTAAWAVGPDDVWAVGGYYLDPNGPDGFYYKWSGCSIAHWDGTSWSRSSALCSDAHYNSVWASGSSDVWVVGAAGAILRRRL